MPELLELAHLVNEHRMADMKIGRRWIESRLHYQLVFFREALFKAAVRQDFLNAAAEFSELLIKISHGLLAGSRVSGAIARSFGREE